MSLDRFKPRDFANSGIGLAGIVERNSADDIVSDELGARAKQAIDDSFIFFIRPTPDLTLYPSTSGGLWAGKPDMRLDARWASFIGGVSQPIEFKMMPQQTKSGGRYLNGARRVIGLHSPYVEGRFRLNAGKASNCSVLLNLPNFTGGGVWAWIGNIAITAEHPAGAAATPLTEKASRAAVLNYAQWPHGIGAAAYEGIDWSVGRYRDHEAFAAGFHFIRSLWLSRHEPIRGNQSIDFAAVTILNFSTEWDGREIGSQ